MLLLGAVSGLAIATLLIVGGVLNKDRGATTPGRLSEQNKLDEIAPAHTPQPEVKFDFYDTLPQLDEHSDGRSADDVPDQNAGHPTVLQAGSFRKRADAESVKARLALLGLVAQIQKARVDGTQWHRVMLGPYASAREADQVRRELLDHGFQAQLRRAVNP